MECIEKLRKCGMTIFYWLVKGVGFGFGDSYW